MTDVKLHSLRISGAVFLIMGVFWLVATLIGEGTSYLLGPVGISIITGSILLVRRGKSKELKTLAIATALSNLVLTGYHTYVAALLFQFGLTSFGGTALAGYAVGSVILIILILTLYSDSQTA